MNLPSRFQLGDLVRVPHMRRAAVTGICFRLGKVSYEVGGLFFESENVNEPMKIVEQEERA